MSALHAKLKALDLRYIAHAILHGGLIAAYLAHGSSSLSNTPYHGDESGWVRASLHVAERLENGNFEPAAWEFEKDGAWGNLNPPLGKFIFSLAHFTMSRNEDGALPAPPEKYYFGHNYRKNLAKGRVATEELRRPLQYVSLLFGALLLITIITLMRHIRGPGAAHLATLLVIFTPQFQLLTKQAMTDVMYAFFCFLTWLCGIWAVESDSVRQMYGRFFISALVAGLACTVKPAALLLLMPFLFAIALTLYLRKIANMPHALVLSSGMLVLISAVCIILNPYFWPDLSRFSFAQLHAEYRLLAHGELSTELPPLNPELTRLIGHGDLSVNSTQLSAESLDILRQKMYASSIEVSVQESRAKAPLDSAHPRLVVPVLYDLLRPLNLPLQYLRWQYLKQYFWSERKALRPTWQGLQEGVLPAAWPQRIQGYLAIAAVPMLFWLAVKEWQRERRARKLAFLIFVLSTTVIVAMTRISDDIRYLFPVLLFRSMLAALAVVILSQRIPTLYAYLLKRQ